MPASGVLIVVKRLLLLVLVFLSSCGQAANTGPVASQAASPSASSSLTTVTAGVSNAFGTLACRLPIAQFDSSGKLAGAFITFPSRELIRDPNSTFQDVSPNGLVKSVVQPQLIGWPRRATFTRRYGRWVPANPTEVSPDSSHYAWAETTNDSPRRNKVHVVDVASGLDHVVRDQVAETNGFFSVVDYQSDGIYLNDVGPVGEAAPQGLWRLDPMTGRLQTIFTNGVVDDVAGGAAWVEKVNPNDPHPPVSLGRGQDRGYPGAVLPDQLLRRDLANGAIASWYYEPGRNVVLLGFDQADHPIVDVLSSTDATEVWLVTAPGRRERIDAGTFSEAPFGPFGDTHGTWLRGQQGIFLYTAAAGLVKVSSVVGDVAGRCL